MNDFLAIKYLTQQNLFSQKCEIPSDSTLVTDDFEMRITDDGELREVEF